jgi:hypothetical protein
MPGLVKIGMTTDQPHVRLGQLSAVTSVPTEFSCAWYAYSTNPARDEKALHRALKIYRVSHNREFFRCSPSFALSTAQSLGLKIAVSNYPIRNDLVLGSPKSEWKLVLVALVVSILLFSILHKQAPDMFLVFKFVVCVIPLLIGRVVAAYLERRQDQF